MFLFVIYKVMKKILAASHGYESWKEKHFPDHKPWLYPEQMSLQRLKQDDIKPMKDIDQSTDSLDESEINEEDMLEEGSGEEDNIGSSNGVYGAGK